MNFRRILRRHIPILTLFALLPTVALLLLTTIYCKVFIESIPFGIVDLDGSTLSRTIVHQLEKHPGLNVSLYADSADALEDAICQETVYGGIVIPRNFYRDVMLKKAPKALLLVDETNMVVGNTLYGYTGTVMGTIGASFQLSSFEGRGLPPELAKSTMTSFSYSERVLYDPKLSFLKYQIHVIFFFLVQTMFFSIYLVPRLVRSRHKIAGLRWGSFESKLTIFELLAEVSFLAVLLCLSSWVALAVTSHFFQIDLCGHVLKHVALVGMLLLDLAAIAMFASTLTDDPATLQIAYLIFGVFLIMSAGIAWPVYMMPRPFSIAVQALWPMQNLTYAFKAAHLKDLSWNVLLPRLGQGALYAAVWGGIGVWHFRRRVLKAKAIAQETIE